MNTDHKPKITLFHCINSFNEMAISPLNGRDDVEMNVVRLACSSMVKDIVLMKAFEAGSDGVLVLVCPEDQCRYVEGSMRAKKRVAWVQNILDQIGLDGRRLSIANISAGNEAAAGKIIQEVISIVTDLGPNPAV
ncbi:MAG: hydrogenase iron-sulfur subunit [Deltaproteobacteria bacterium]|nr:hydrogenase iron-sulfur subunit [Deltaproteobacteria bacterium]